MAKGKTKAADVDPAVEDKLIKAIQSTDAKSFNTLLQAGFKLDAKLKRAQNQTALAVARQYDALDIVIALLKAGANPAKGKVDVFWAVYIDRADLVKLLIECGADVNYEARIMGRALPFAASRNNLKMMRLLIDSGADLNAGAPVTKAVKEGAMEGALLLLKSGAKVPPGEGLLALAAHRGHLPLVQALIAAGADVNERADIQHWNEAAIRHEDLYSETTPLTIATREGDEKIVKAILDAGADVGIPDPDGLTALDWAKRLKKTKIAKQIEAIGSKSAGKSDPRAGLMFAAEQGDLKSLRAALASGVKVDARDTRKRSKDFTPLMLAAMAGQADTVSALLEAGADIGASDNLLADNAGGFSFIYNEGGAEVCREAGYQMHRTALHLAAENGHGDIIKLLTARGADVNAPDRVKMTPLLLAADAGHTDAVRELIRAGANVNARDKSKDTAAHLAATNGHVEVIRELISANAKLDLKGSSGYTPLNLAADRAYAEATHALIEGGADASAGLLSALGTHLLIRDVDADELITRFQIPEDEVRDTVRVLLEGGADPALTDDDGANALQKAREIAKMTGKAKEILRMLERHDAGKRRK